MPIQVMLLCIEMISRNKLTKWWEITSNLNLYTSDIFIDDPLQVDQEALASWFGKLNNSFKLPYIFHHSIIRRLPVQDYFATRRQQQ